MSREKILFQDFNKLSNVISLLYVISLHVRAVMPVIKNSNLPASIKIV